MTQPNQKMSQPNQQNQNQKYQPDVRAGKDVNEDNKYSKQSGAAKEGAWKDTERKTPV